MGQDAPWKVALRSPGLVLTGSEAQVGPLIATGAVAAAVFGAVVGVQHSGWMSLYAGLKLPIVLVVPVAVCMPLIQRTLALTGAPEPWGRLMLAAATLVARAGLLMMVGIPFLWLMWTVQFNHTTRVQAVAGVMAAAFAFALTPLVRAWPSFTSRAVATTVLALTLGQTAWLLRPFVGVPGAPAVPFEPPSGNFIQGLSRPTYVSVGEDLADPVSIEVQSPRATAGFTPRPDAGSACVEEGR
jgi:hypothetical protein